MSRNKNITNDAGKAARKVVRKAAKPIGKTSRKVMRRMRKVSIRRKITRMQNAADIAVSLYDSALQNMNITPGEIIREAAKQPIATVDRSEFLRQELSEFCPEETIAIAIEQNPASAGIDRETIDKIAARVIQADTNKVTSASFASGISARKKAAGAHEDETTHYFAYTLKAMQQLAYLYGFGQFDLTDGDISDDTLNQFIIMLGAMFGVKNAGEGVKAIAHAAGVTAADGPEQAGQIAEPSFRRIAGVIGLRIAEHVIAEGVSRKSPIVGGAMSGSVTYAAFKPSCVRLMRVLQGLSEGGEHSEGETANGDPE